MTWTRLSDNWTERADLGHLSHADRWHYLSLIVLCSRSGALDGRLRLVDARRASDHEDPGAALSRLLDLGLIEMTGAGVRIVEIEDHVPPPSVREASEKAKYRMRRSRAHKEGNHSMCLPRHCEKAPASNGVTGDVTRNTGTGRDGTGQDYSEASEPEKSGVTAEPEGDGSVPVIEDVVDPETGQRRQRRVA